MNVLLSVIDRMHYAILPNYDVNSLARILEKYLITNFHRYSLFSSNLVMIICSRMRARKRKEAYSSIKNQILKVSISIV